MSETPHLQTWLRKKEDVREKITRHLNRARLDDQIRQKSLTDVFANLSRWMEDESIDSISPHAKQGILDAIDDKRWSDLSEAFYTDIEFGTGGIRGRAVIRDNELALLKEEGIKAPFLRGPNTINDLVFARISASIAQFGQDRNYKSIVIGYDSRIRGRDFAHLIASVFIAYDFKVFLFDDVVPYPEVTFAIPHLKANMGILVSASHNDRRYNGYKLSCANGSQFSIEDRAIILNEYVSKTGFDRIRIADITTAGKDSLVFLGGGYRYPHLQYYSYEGKPLDLHSEHFSHVLDFVLDKQGIRQPDSEKVKGKGIHIAYSAYNGAGGPTMKRLVEALGIIKFDVIEKLYKVDGMFPAFADLKTSKGVPIYQQPDPGEARAAATAMREYKSEYGVKRLGPDGVDLLIGTDPDADRTGISVRVPVKHREICRAKDKEYGLLDKEQFTLLDADTAWSLIMWYRMEHWQKIEGLKRLGITLDDCFLVQSHTTTDIMPLLARKYGLGVVKTWVGFAQLATGAEKVWNRTLREHYFSSPNTTSDFKSIYEFDAKWFEARSSKPLYNFAALEQSNGFSILGAKPPTPFDLGEYGHVRDKDGTFAAILFLDVLAYAKRHGMDILELADTKLYLDPAIGLIRTGYRAAPQFGQYEGLEGRSKKLEILRKSAELIRRFQGGKPVRIGKRLVTKAEEYKTGKYDIQHGHTREAGFDPARRETYTFPDEGIRFFFGNDYSHLTIRPSGTSQSLRFHVQLRDTKVTRGSLKARRIAMEKEIQLMFASIGKLVGVDWNE